MVVYRGKAVTRKSVTTPATLTRHATRTHELFSSFGARGMGNQASTAASNRRGRSEVRQHYIQSAIRSQQKAEAEARAAAAAALARRIEEWEQLNAAMTAHEHAAALSCTALSCYWIKQCVGLTFELPFRWAYHSCCSCTGECCCFCPDSHATHHLSTVQEYSALANIMAANLLEPCHPTYIYTPHVELTRPPYPAAPSAHEENMVSGKRNGEQDGEQDCCDSVLCCCGFFECDEKDCCEIRGCGCLCCCGSFSCGWTDCGVCCLSCTPIEQPFYRELRSLLCVFSCCSACHCGRCCGPICHCETMSLRDRGATARALGCEAGRGHGPAHRGLHARATRRRSMPSAIPAPVASSPRPISPRRRRRLSTVATPPRPRTLWSRSRRRDPEDPAHIWSEKARRRRD